MPGGITYDPGSVPLARPSARLAVYRYVPDAVDPQPRYELLPNVRCVGVEKPKEGGDPGAARFRYVFVDPALAPDDPRRFEQVYPLAVAGDPGVVKTDDRLVVRAFRGDGYSAILFDGFALVPQADLDAETEAVTFTAVGTPVRERDTPLAGAFMRDADQPDITSDRETSLPARFNPDGRPNATPTDGDAELGNTGILYPTFLGPFPPTNEINGQTVRPWTLGMAARYVICRGNPDREWTTYDNLSYLDAILIAVEPTSEDGVIDLLDGSTYTVEDIEVQDLDVTGMAWPEALARLVEPHGFGFRFILEEDDVPEDADPGTLPDPRWTFRVYRKDTAVFPKDLHLQVAGGAFDPAQTNLGTLALARDIADLANRIVVDTAPVRVEASFVLAPLFEVANTDTDGGTPKHFVEGDTSFTGANRDKYRLFGLDECGEGHWDFGTGSWVTGKAADLAKVLGFGESKRSWVRRRRPGVGTLVNVDDKGEPLKWRLDVSGDYVGPEPGVWDGTGTWQQVVSGELDLLDDRLGIRVTCKDPNSWWIGTPTQATPPFPEGKLCLVEQIATPGTTAGTRPKFRLTCCIDSDAGLDASVNRRTASPTEFAITRRVDARDRFRKQVVSKWSALNQAGVGISDDVVTDDTVEAAAHARGVQRSRESGVFAGTATIPRLSTAYDVGDAIRSIDGRDVSLRTNAAAEAGESPVYPVVVAVSYDFDGKQTTTLEISDRRGEPPPERRRRDRL